MILNADTVGRLLALVIENVYLIGGWMDRLVGDWIIFIYVYYSPSLHKIWAGLGIGTSFALL